MMMMMSQKDDDYERDDVRSECCRRSFLQHQRELRPLYANVGRTMKKTQRKHERKKEKKSVQISPISSVGNYFYISRLVMLQIA